MLRREFLQALAASVAGSVASLAQNTTLVRFPYIQDVRRTRATVRWTVREPGDGTVEYWSDSNVITKVQAQVAPFLPRDTAMEFPYYRYEAVLKGLSAGMEYRYRASMNGVPVTFQPLSFSTPGAQAFPFLVFGDSGTGSAEQQRIARMLREQKSKLVIHTGDLVYPTGTYSRYESLYFEYYKDIMKDVPFFPCPGNHDYYELKCLPYRVMNSLPDESIHPDDVGRYYSFDWGNAHFVSLDSNDSLEAAARGEGHMLEWLDKDLSNTDKFWRIVFLHHPPYSAGNHSHEHECEQVRKWIVPILDKHRVPLVLNGHEHSYQRSYTMRAGKVTLDEGTTYVTTGGGGADLHPVYETDFIKIALSQHHFLSCNVNGAKLDLKAIGVDGNEIDAHTLTPLPLLSENAVVDSASYQDRLANGGLATIFGHQLSPETLTAVRYPLPKLLGGISVLVNDRPAPILMTSANQVNVQLPFDVAGTATLELKTANGSVKTGIHVYPVAPAIFDGAIFHANGMQITEETPARPGEFVSFYLTGLGLGLQPLEAGEAAPEIAMQTSVQVRVGEASIVPEFSGFAKGVAGVNVVRFQIPSTVQITSPLSLIAAGSRSNTIPLFVRA